MNYKLSISYDGTAFSGWQNQPNIRTVQFEIEEAINKIFSDKNIKLIGSGRTDSGVHAYGQVANFITDTTMSTKQIKNALNSKLQNDIFIKDCINEKENFHSRFSASKREYIYSVSTEYMPTNRLYSWFVNYEFDSSKLIECSELIKGEHDFTSFSKLSSEAGNKNCIIFNSQWIKKDTNYIYRISGNRFLHHMVRFLIGTMFEVARGRFTIENFQDMLNCKKSNCYPVCAAAKGLFLNNVYYEK